MPRALLLLALAACAPLPPLIHDTQVNASLPPALHPAGMRCAARLNGHVRAARSAGAARTSLAGSGALLAGAGVALSEASRDVGLGLAVGGAVLALVADLVVRLTGDPAALLAAHARGLASWDAARRGGSGEDLERCTRDLAPERAALPPAGDGVAP